MTRSVEEPSRPIPVLDEVDVLVAGGGVASALAAKAGVPTADVDIRNIQAGLLAQGVNLADAARLKSLNLT